MKNLIIATFMVVFAAIGGVQAQTASCDECQSYTVLTGVMPDDRTLVAGTKYLISDCYVVPDGITLTIPAGTQLFGDVTTKGMLIVDRGGVLIANGASNNPIIFTSCLPVDEREAGDWGGIAIFGKATNNVSGGEIPLTRCSTIYTGGHATTFVDNDNSGSLQYVQIHYAGQGKPGDAEVHGLTLVSVGSSTVLEHIQVTNSFTNGIKYLGGTVNGKYLAGFNNRWTDFWYTRGYNGMGQFIMSLRNPAVYDNVNPQFSNGILAENNDIGPGYAGSPLTNPILSNVSIWGPKYCDDELSLGVISGVALIGNTAASIYNSFVGGYENGFFVRDNQTILNAQNDLINFGYSSFYQNSANFVSNPINFDPNNDFCVTTIAEWMIDNSEGCEEPFNAELSLTPGYDNSLCNENYCGINRPEFVLSSNNLGSASFAPDALDDDFFTTIGVNYRGAFGNSDWTEDWTNWCPLATDYCPELQQRRSGRSTNNRLHIAPNPSSDISYALFDVTQTGKVQISVRDKVSGQELRSGSHQISATGSHRIAIPAAGLQAGVYIVQVVLPDGSVLSGQLFML